jgi:hypothetical protein
MLVSSIISAINQLSESGTGHDTEQGLSDLVNGLEGSARFNLHTALLLAEPPILNNDEERLVASSFPAGSSFDRLKNNCMQYLKVLRKILFNNKPAERNLKDYIMLITDNEVELPSIKDELLGKLFDDEDPTKIYDLLIALKNNTDHKFEIAIKNYTSENYESEFEKFTRGLLTNLRPFFTELFDKAVKEDRVDIVQALIDVKFRSYLNILSSDQDGASDQISRVIYKSTVLDIDAARILAEEHSSSKVLELLDRQSPKS